MRHGIPSLTAVDLALPMMMALASACAGSSSSPAATSEAPRPPVEKRSAPTPTTAARALRQAPPTPPADDKARGSATPPSAQRPPAPATDSTGGVDEPHAIVADVLAVKVLGKPGKYTFAVRLRSPDTGCDQYADFWEVLSPDGMLLYRRILAHSHVDEQPFTRTGGPVPIDRNAPVLVRAHMSPGGFGGTAMRGSAANGFEAVGLAPDFALAVTEQAPLPAGCAF